MKYMRKVECLFKLPAIIVNGEVWEKEELLYCVIEEGYITLEDGMMFPCSEIACTASIIIL